MNIKISEKTYLFFEEIPKQRIIIYLGGDGCVIL